MGSELSNIVPPHWPVDISVPTIAGRYLCTELVFDLFVCPALIDPMLYGLASDVTVSHNARHNLIQVARILQVLSKGQRSDERKRVPDLYSLFEEVGLILVPSV